MSVEGSAVLEPLEGQRLEALPSGSGASDALVVLPARKLLLRALTAQVAARPLTSANALPVRALDHLHLSGRCR